MPKTLKKKMILHGEELVGTVEAARILGLSKCTLENYRTNRRCQDLGPNWVRVGGRVYYSVKELDRYLEGKRDGSYVRGVETYVRTGEVDA